MHSLIYHVIKHLLRGLAIVIHHLIHQAPAAHTAVRHAATVHKMAANTLPGRPASGASNVAAMHMTRAGNFPVNNTAAALHGFNQQSNIMASVGQEQAAAIPDFGDFSY